MNDRIKTFPYTATKNLPSRMITLLKKNFRHGENPLIFIVELSPLKKAVEFCFDKLNGKTSHYIYLHVLTSLRHVKLCLFTN